MKKVRPRLALCALVLPFVLPTAAHADPYLNTCTVTTGDITSFTATCAAVVGGSNADSGTYSFTFSWAGGINPCMVPSGPVGGGVTWTGPGGPPYTPGTALAVINPTGLHDLNFAFGSPSVAGASAMRSGFFRFTCSFGVGVVQSGGQISRIEHVYSAGTLPNSAYCAPGSVNGTASYNLPAGTTGTSQATISLTMQCTGAPGSISAGTYTITSQGAEVGGCQTGNGTGTISGTGPNGQSVRGAWAYNRSGIHYFGFPPNGTGYIRLGSSEKAFGFYLWLDLPTALVGPTGGLACPLPGGPITPPSHALVIG